MKSITKGLNWLNAHPGVQLLLLAAAALFAAVTGTSGSAIPLIGLAGAVVLVKSSAITNADATPPRLNPAYIAKSRVYEQVGVFAFANGDSAASIYRAGRIRSNDRVVEVIADNDALGAGAAYKVGLYDTIQPGGVAGAAVSDALFFPATVVAAAQAKANNLTNVAPANREKRVWELLGLTTDPQKEYDVAVTLTVATAAAGSFALTVRTVQN